MIGSRRLPLIALRQELENAYSRVSDLGAVLSQSPPPATEDEYRRQSAKHLDQLSDIRQSLQRAITLIAEYQAKTRSPSQRRAAFLRRFSRLRIKRRPRHNGPVVLTPEQMQVSAAVAKEQMRMNAELHEQAVQIVGSTLERINRREREVVQTNPEIAPYLRAYNDLTNHVLLQNTSDLLRKSWLDPFEPEEKGVEHGPA